MSDEEVPQVPRGLTLEQAQNLRRDRRIDELAARMDEIIKRLDTRAGDSSRKGNSNPNSGSSEEEQPRRNPRRPRNNYSSSDESPRPRRSDRPKDDDRNLRLDLPEFNGSMNEPEKYFEWIRRAETLFDYKEYDERKRCKVAELKLTGYASLWYDNLKKKRHKEGRARISTWEQLKKHMKKEEIVEHKIARFISGLNDNTAEKVELQQYWSFEDVCKNSLEKSGSSSNYKETKSKFEAPKKLVEDRKCFKCGSVGHIATNCPSKRVMTAQEWEQEQAKCEQGSDYVEKNEEENFEEEEGHIDEIDPETHGQSLVLRRALHSKTVPMENNQREKIFLTRCKVEDRLCDMIIDTGSCTNVVSTTLVDKLTWPITEHPSPYKRHWLNNSSDVKVTKQALISFSIGKFHDKVLCDVCPMDACHILLGRPWQYDRFVKFDGRTNVERELEKEICSNNLVYILVSNEIRIDQDKQAKRSYELESVLEEFKDVFPKELPPGLPPIRWIEHQIDLIPGAPLPNKAAYRSNPEEKKEFAYNRSPTYATKHSPFEVVYGVNPKLPIDLVPLPKGELIHKDAESKLKSMRNYMLKFEQE
ncbi:uncharacterized protein LOC110684585 [Chenopodium quinoa]|uniref:uncharacterized protein LOC110684585 n=1 Tax=Chenopodium quinoa TaxID=63459 RepID=UPI000B76BA6F|nr:uncharacterized protein LOC110684585 [Chenopodium quinoa]